MEINAKFTKTVLPVHTKNTAYNSIIMPVYIFVCHNIIQFANASNKHATTQPAEPLVLVADFQVKG